MLCDFISVVTVVARPQVLGHSPWACHSHFVNWAILAMVVVEGGVQ